jgi:hypothetical protein
MKKRKQQLLESAGWTVGSAKDFLELTDEETALVFESVDYLRQRKGPVDESEIIVTRQF